MQSSKRSTVTPIETETAAEIDQLPVHSPQYALLAEYIKEHKLPGGAANDPHQLALSDFLREHMQLRANAQPEPTENSQPIIDNGD